MSALRHCRSYNRYLSALAKSQASPVFKLRQQYKALTRSPAPHTVGMANLDLETEVLRRVMLGELKTPVLDDSGGAPLTCMGQSDALGELLDRRETIGGRTNLYIQRADGTIATLSVSEVVPGTDGII